VSAAPAAGPSFFVGADEDALLWGNSQQTATVARTLGLRSIRITLQWKPGQAQVPAAYQTALKRLVLDSYGIRVVVSVYGLAADTPHTPEARSQFCSFAADLLRSYPTINDVVVWTEPNSATFWRPQSGAPEAYEALLAQCWDLLHAVSSRVNVIAASAPHQNPAAWFAGVGAAFRASGRTQRIFDTVGHNAYPEHSAESPRARHTGTSIDQGDYDRLISVLQKAFGGTAQPTPGLGGVTVWYMETGFQTRVTRGRHLYSGVETDRRAVSEEKQAALLADAVRLAYCQPYVGAFFNFELRDETSLAGWQSGVIRADWTPKPSFFAYRDAIIDVLQKRIACS